MSEKKEPARCVKFDKIEFWHIATVALNPDPHRPEQLMLTFKTNSEEKAVIYLTPERCEEELKRLTARLAEITSAHQ